MDFPVQARTINYVPCHDSGPNGATRESPRCLPTIMVINLSSRVQRRGRARTDPNDTGRDNLLLINRDLISFRIIGSRKVSCANITRERWERGERNRKKTNKAETMNKFTP